MWLRIFLLLVLGATLAAAEPLAGGGGEPMRLSAPEVRAELVEVVGNQLAAFRAGDWKRAYAQSARSFQAVIALPQFMTLITKNYGVVWKNTRAEFGLPRDNGRVAVVPARVFSAQGSIPYQWLLVKEDGHWRITGVIPQRVGEGA